MPAQRIEHITQANATFLAFIETWDRHRFDPEVADFAFGYPQEMPVDGFAPALIAATDPIDTDHYGYKRSEDEPRRSVAKHLEAWRGQPFEPEDFRRARG